MVMELLEGWTLGDLIHYQAPLSPALAIAIATQVCDALEEAHRRRLVHRDLKPDNVLLSTVEDGVWAKVLDFGIARVMRDPNGALTVNESTVEIAGTPAYMSPEQILGKQPDPRSDLYALGVILYELVTKERPFHDDTSVALCMRQLNEAPRRPSTLVDGIEGLEDVILSLMNKRAEDRPASAALVKRMLLACPQAGGVIDVTSIGRQSGGLGQVTTRGDVGALMAQATLDVSLDAETRVSTPQRIGLVSPAKNDPLASMSDLSFVPGHAAAAPGPTVSLRADLKPTAVGAVAHLIADHPSVIKSDLVTSWLQARRLAGASIGLETQTVVLRAPLGRGSNVDAARVLADALCELQRAALKVNLALRAGVTPVGEAGLSAAVDLSRRLAAKAAHGAVQVDGPTAEVLGATQRPVTEIYLPTGGMVAAVALTGGTRTAKPLLWGRSIQLRRLGQLADEARRKGPVSVVVRGAKGMGKSSVIDAFVAGRPHVLVRVSPAAACWPGHTLANLAAAALNLPRLTGEPAQLDNVKLPAAKRGLLQLLLCDRPADDPPTTRQIVRLVVDLLAQRAADGPLVVAIDDAHHIDQASLEMLTLVRQMAEGRPWLFLCASRWLKPGMLFADAHRVDLRALSMRAANALLDAAGVTPRQRHAFMAGAQGNPLALTLLAKAPPEVALRSFGEQAIAGLLPAHLRGLPGPAAGKAWLDAVLGVASPSDLAAHAARLYLDRGPGDAIAAWLEGRLKREGPVPARLARAWGASDPQDPARRAERCERLGLWRQAAVEYENALAQAPATERGDNLLRAAQMRARAGDIKGALSSYDASLRDRTHAHRPTALIRFADVLMQIGEKARAGEVLDAAGDALAQQQGAPHAVAEVAALKARACVRRGDHVSAMQWLSRARDAAARLKRTDARGARALEALSQEIRAEVAVALADFETARVNLRQARDAFRDLGQHADAVRCLVDLGRLELECGLGKRAVETLTVGLELATGAGLGGEALRAGIALGEAQAMIGDDEGGRRLRAALRQASEAGLSSLFAAAALGLSQAMARRSLWPDALRYAHRARHATSDSALTARSFFAEARAELGAGNRRKALRALDHAAAIAADCGDGLLSRRVRELYQSVAGHTNDLPQVAPNLPAQATA